MLNKFLGAMAELSAPSSSSNTSISSSEMKESITGLGVVVRAFLPDLDADFGESSGLCQIKKMELVNIS